MNFAYVINEFLRSPKYAGLKPSTQYNVRHALTIVQEELGMLAVEQIRPSAVQKFLDQHADFPGKQTLIRSALKAVERWAIVRDFLPYPITTGTEAIKSKGGHRPWTDAQIDCAIREARPDIARAVALTANTGQRGSDIVRMQWTDIEKYKGREGIRVTQKKTGRRLWVPFNDGFSQELATWEKKFPPFLVLSPEGCPYTRQWLSKQWSVEKANNPRLSSLKSEKLTLHGLRAAKVIGLRREGYTESDIANLVGMSVPMVSHYCRLADQQEAAFQAMERNENSAGQNNVISINKPLKTNDTTL